MLTESGAILYYLAAHKDQGNRLLPADPAGRAEALSWVFFQTASRASLPPAFWGRTRVRGMRRVPSLLQGHLAGPTFTVVTAALLGMQHSGEAMEAAAQGVHAAFQLLDARLERTGGRACSPAAAYRLADVAGWRLCGGCT